jgi:hypothetical protein
LHGTGPAYLHISEKVLKVKHNLENEPSSQEISICDRDVKRLYRRYEGTEPQEDMYLYRLTLEDLLKKSLT